MITPASLPTAMLIDIYRQLEVGDETAIRLINEELEARSERGDLAAIAFIGNDF